MCDGENIYYVDEVFYNKDYFNIEDEVYKQYDTVRDSEDNDRHPPNLSNGLANASSDESFDCENSPVLVNPQTGLPINLTTTKRLPIEAFVTVNPNLVYNVNIPKPLSPVSSSSSSSSGSSGSDDDDDETEDDNSTNIVDNELEQKKENLLDTKNYPKPVYSYSCLISMALKNSESGCLPVSEIYSFITQNYPYFKTANNGWKNSVRHNLSLNKCFAKVTKPTPGKQRKGCLWRLNPDRVEKMDDEVFKWSQKDPNGIKSSMAKPEEFGFLEKFCDKHERQMEDIRVEVANQHKRKMNREKHHLLIRSVIAEDKKISNGLGRDEMHSDESLDDFLLESSYHTGCWNELDEKANADFPLTADHFFTETQRFRNVKIKV
ncbi:Forkhead box protein N1 [Chamberlinius hualienensis]